MKKIAIAVALMMLVQVASGQAAYEKSIELAGGPALNSHTQYSVGANTTHGILSNNFFIGAGVGFRYTSALYYSSYRSYYQFGSLQTETYKSYDGKYLVPVYIRASYRFGRASVKPMLSFDVGATFDVGKNQKYKNTEGLFYEPADGVNISLDDNTSMFITVGLNYQNAHHTYYTMSYYDGTSTEEIKGRASTLHFRIGFTF